jgi:competence protein ComEA
MNGNKSFSLPRNQRTGMLVLVFLVVVIFLAYRIYDAHQKPAMASLSEKELLAWRATSAPGDSLLEEQDIKSDYSQIHTSYPDHKIKIKGAAPFDPNNASLQEMTAAGLSKRIAQTIINYRNKGGRFVRPEDLMKIYGLNDELYKQVQPYISIQASGQARAALVATSRQQTKKIELNTTDAAELIKLRGIGPVFANRIVKFRDKLGGFVRVEQLNEVYGLPDSTYQSIKDLCTVDISKVKKININEASEQELTDHAYLNKQQARAIIELRNEVNRFTKIEDLRQIALINEEKYRKIASYLTVD